MFQTLKTGDRLNVRVKAFVTKAITPVVLLAGLLILVVYHFHGVLQLTTAQQNQYNGIIAYSGGPLAVTFDQNAGTNRPQITFADAKVLSIVDWDSTISVDGTVTNLWDSSHGYSQDNTKRQIFSTSTGTNWQVIQIITLLTDRTVQVQYEFVAPRVDSTEPQNVVLTISHLQQSLEQPQIKGNTLTALVLPHKVTSLTNTSVPKPMGTLTVKVSGPAVSGNDIGIQNLQAQATSTNSLVTVFDTFTTTYTVRNPQVDRMIPLGTETITYNTSIAPGQPLPSSSPTP